MEESEHSNETNKKLPEIDEISFGGRQYIILSLVSYQ